MGTVPAAASRRRTNPFPPRFGVDDLGSGIALTPHVEADAGGQGGQARIVADEIDRREICVKVLHREIG